MSPLGGMHQPLRRIVACLIAVLVVLTAGMIDADADEAGISFWVPGTYGALAAAPLPQGFSLAEVYYHSPVKAGADVATAIQVPRAGVMATLPATQDFHLGVQTDLLLSIPSYVFATPVFGGQLSVGLLIPYGRNKVSVDQTLIGPRGVVASSTGGPLTESVSGLGDLEPQTSLRWNFGVHNFMVYMTGDIPLGLYSPVQLANIGYGHGAIDGGGGYTYFNEKTGNEFSAVLGFTYNFINPSTQYQNGVDVHFDWSASKFLTKQIELGAAGYFYNQASCDTGAGAVLGCFETRVLGIGPQFGYVVPLGALQGYLNIKAYRDFDWAHRAEGWSGWLTFVISNSPTDAQHTPPHR